jgi:hypothetical protein
MKRLLHLALLLLCLLPIHLHAVEDAKIDELLQKPFIKADFKKERKLKILSKPFVTYGYMLFKPDKGVIWKTTQPIIDTILIAEEEIRQLDKIPAGTQPVPVNNPIMASASKMFLTILSLDKEKILSVFDYSVEKNANNIRYYKLVPKEEKLRQLVSAIKLSGQDRIDVIEIVEASGDSTTIYLSNEIFDKTKLNQEELALFESI